MMTKILYLPIFEPGGVHDIAVLNKRGLYNALVKRGCEVVEYDYLASDNLEQVDWLIQDIQPDLLLTQLHGHEPVTVEIMQRWRALWPAMRVVNWSGDSWRHGLVGEKYLPLVRQFDLQLVAAPDVLPEYEALGIRAAFWQIAYEAPVGELPEMPWYDIVFLGNAFTDQRKEMMQRLKALETKDLKIGIYGDWEHADGYNCYDFGQGEALYKYAKVAIADNTYIDQQNYVSNRPIQILMAGGAVLLHQYVAKMPDLLGIKPGVHYIVWHDLDDLMFKAKYWVQQYGGPIQGAMVKRGQEYAQACHTYDSRVEQLFDELLPMIEGVEA